MSTLSQDNEQTTNQSRRKYPFSLENFFYDFSFFYIKGGENVRHVLNNSIEYSV